jgi:hypothetical protein
MFYCPATYTMTAKTGQGPDRSLGGACDGSPFGPLASIVLGVGTRVSLSLCATDSSGAKLSLSGALTGPNDRSVTVKGTWSENPGDAVAPAQLDGTLDLVRLGSIGDLVEGTFSTTSASSTLSGTFHACHQFDDAISRPPSPRPLASSNGIDAPCADAGGYYIEVAADGGTTRFASSCANSTVDVGAVGAVGGPFSPHDSSAQQILLEACSDRGEDAAKISIVGGASSGVTVYLRDRAGKISLAYNQPEMDPATLRIGPLGGAIEGTFAATLKGDAWAEGPTISGSFRACHLQDLNLIRTP